MCMSIDIAPSLAGLAVAAVVVDAAALPLEVPAIDVDWNVHATADPDAVIPTRETYGQLQHAYNYLNRHLFDGQLPNCLITLQRRARSYGYFCGGRFAREDGARTDEIALNPDHFHQGIVETLSTLGHEMAHLWQHHFGKPGRGRYHNSEWATEMHAIGLPPSDTGKPGGKETGDCVSNYIDSEGPFAKAVVGLLDAGFELTWIRPHPQAVGSPRDPNGDNTESVGTGLESRGGRRVKYTCPHCKLGAWAKHGASLLCGVHRVGMKAERTTVGSGTRDST
jgi:predicted SprT family Zn-dependent metalloprotease